VERGSLAGWSLAIPATILELIIQKTVDQPIAGLTEISARRQDSPVDAGLGFAVEVGPAVELPPGDAVLYKANRAANFLIRRIRAEIFQ
jgi:hypothetical protein